MGIIFHCRHHKGLALALTSKNDEWAKFIDE